MRVELSESICRPSLLHRATGCWVDVCMSWRTKAFWVSRWRSRDVRARIRRRHDRTRLRISDCVWAVHACRGVSGERRDGSRLFHVLRGSGAHVGGEVFPDHEWRRTRLGELLDFLFHDLLRVGPVEHRCVTAQRQKQSTACLIAMRSRKSPASCSGALIVLAVFSIGGTLLAQSSSDWKAPPTAANRPNPVPANANTIALGQKLYVGNCMTCHGPSGRGDGPGGAALEKKPADLGARIRSGESDGALFWKISEGRSPMVSWRGSLSETQRWELVNYIKTFAGK
jgi:mono/diheme cytochrome c family protein